MQVLDRRVLPGLEVEVSAIGAGCWTIGGPASNDGVPIGWDGVNDAAAFDALIQAYELGVSLFDTADVYGLGRSERLVGRLLGTVDRASVVVCSKVGYFAGTSRHPYEPAQMRHQFDTSLANLGAGYLDGYFFHSTCGRSAGALSCQVRRQSRATGPPGVALRPPARARRGCAGRLP
jgi:aryl-alcohol dehydrogenase-like predicted oxidoreductase